MRTLICAITLAVCAWGQSTHHAVVPVWKAMWIEVPGTQPQAYGVYHFRRTFSLPAAPANFIVHVSGDNRYQLYVNGKEVSWGPARGDLTHWRFETVDIGPQLKAGKNVLAAVVWNDGEYRAVAQISNRTAFVLQSQDPGNNMVNSNRDWKCVEDKAYRPQPIAHDQLTGYYALAANERFDASTYPWGWQQPDFDDSAWADAHIISHAADRDARDAPNRWMLVASEIPLEERHPEQPLAIREADGVPTPASPRGILIPAHTKAAILFDQGHLTTACPELEISGGLHAQLSLRYAEALYTAAKQKADRNQVVGMQFFGPADTYLSDGADHRTYRPLFWRTYRYLRLEVQTAEAPVTVDGVTGVFTAYPFQERAAFAAGDAADNASIQKVLATGWHTARLCAHETYMDCPFYEQLQYAGDARIQMMISLYMTGDARLMKNGIGLLNSSRTAEGATFSRAPSALQQYIPPFSLWWIGMVHDYWMYVDDSSFVKQMLPGVQAVLSFYSQYQKPNGSLAHMPWWNFVDWVKQWPNGEPPAEADGSSAAALDLQLLMAYRWAADVEAQLGSKALADEYTASADRLGATILATDWDPARRLFADQPSHRTYSQHVNTLAVLANLIHGEQARSVVEKTLSDPSLAQSSIYFRAYTNATLREVGLGSQYAEALGPWRHMLTQGLTTWAEWDGPDARSDCHAWGASPNFEFLRTVAGIESAAPGFKKVRIAPNLDQLGKVSARMPHPQGEIAVHLQKQGSRIVGTAKLPEGITGEFDWAGQKYRLHGGENQIAY